MQDDARVVLDLLQDHTPLPTEILIEIIDLAGIWISSKETPDLQNIQRCAAGDLLVTSSSALTAIGARRLRRIVCRTTSRDQGWSSDVHFRGTFDQSWTWFEARTRTKDKVSTHELYRNRHAGVDFESYVITSDTHKELLSCIEDSSQIELWMCARFPGWMNHCSSATIELQFADGFDEQELFL